MILKLDFASDIPIYLQIRNQIVLGVADGQLMSGERLPTIRALADEIGVNTMTVSKPDTNIPDLEISFCGLGIIVILSLLILSIVKYEPAHR